MPTKLSIASLKWPPWRWLLASRTLTAKAACGVANCGSALMAARIFSSALAAFSKNVRDWAEIDASSDSWPAPGDRTSLLPSSTN